VSSFQTTGTATENARRPNLLRGDVVGQSVIINGSQNEATDDWQHATLAYSNPQCSVLPRRQR